MFEQESSSRKRSPPSLCLAQLPTAGISSALAEQGPVAAGGLVHERPPQAPRKGRRRQKKVGSTAPSAVQRLLEACNKVFADGGAGIVPSPDDVEWLRSVLAAPPPGLRLAKVKTDAIFNESSRTSVLYPEEGGNMHCFTARISCAVPDVLGPPYFHPEEGREGLY